MVGNEVPELESNPESLPASNGQLRPWGDSMWAVRRILWT